MLPLQIISGILLMLGVLSLMGYVASLFFFVNLERSRRIILSPIFGFIGFYLMYFLMKNMDIAMSYNSVMTLIVVFGVLLAWKFRSPK